MNIHWMTFNTMLCKVGCRRLLIIVVNTDPGTIELVILHYDQELVYTKYSPDLKGKLSIHDLCRRISFLVILLRLYIVKECLLNSRYTNTLATFLENPLQGGRENENELLCCSAPFCRLNFVVCSVYRNLQYRSSSCFSIFF